MKPRVYFAAKLPEAKQLREIRDAWPSIEVTSRWIDMVHLKDDTNQRDEAAAHWSIDEVDVRRSDFIVVFPGDNLRGALVEVGIGIACGKTIVLIGNCFSYGTWQYHPLIKRADNVLHAINCILGQRQFL